MGGYEPTDGDGRYARIYVRNLEPRSEDTLPAGELSLDALAAALDAALSAGYNGVAARQIRLIRARARLTSASTINSAGAP